MPSSSSFCAMTSLSSTENETDSPCVPSRSVVSKVKIFMASNLGRRNRLPHLLRYTYFFLLLEERHHGAQFAADALDELVARFFAHVQKLLTARLVLVDP